MPRKKMIEEMAIAIARKQAKSITKAYEDKQTLFKGQVPEYNGEDAALISSYVIVAGVWNRAVENAKKISELNVDKNARKLIVTEDKKFMDSLYKDMKEALVDYSDEALAHLLANKRVEDYKEANSMREVADTNALGSTVWIIECDRVNRKHLENYNSLEEQLATHYLSVFIHTLATVV